MEYVSFIVAIIVGILFFIAWIQLWKDFYFGIRTFNHIIKLVVASFVLYLCGYITIFS